MHGQGKEQAPRNRTITLSAAEIDLYTRNLITLAAPVPPEEIENKTIHQDLRQILDWLPLNFVDLLFIAPPYNLHKSFNTTKFQKLSLPEYGEWLESWLPKLVRVLKPTASVYIGADWYSSAAVHLVAE